MPRPAASPTVPVAGNLARSSDVVAVERWFVRRGLPHFIAGYSAGTDIWTRSLPILGVAYVAGGFNALDLQRWSATRNLVAAVVALAVAAIGLMAANRLRHRPALSIPRRIGAGELALVVVGPAVPSLLFGQPGDALQTVLEGAAVLVIIYVVTSYGLVPMTRWAATQLGDQLVALGRLVVKALPLLLLFVTFLFINEDVWEVAGRLDGVAYWLTLALFVVIGVGFVLSRVPSDLVEVNQFESWEAAAALAAAAGAPVVALAPAEERPALHHPLRRRALFNIVLVMLTTQAIQIVLVGAVMGAFLVTFGVLAIDRPVVESWSLEADVLWAPTLGGRELVLTMQLLRVSGFLAAFTALYFTVYLVTDATYREQFRDDVVRDVRAALAARVCYLGALETGGTDA